MNHPDDTINTNEETVTMTKSAYTSWMRTITNGIELIEAACAYTDAPRDQAVEKFGALRDAADRYRGF